jgi:hypothetical protein
MSPEKRRRIRRFGFKRKKGWLNMRWIVNKEREGENGQRRVAGREKICNVQ